mmetsp:Transcript_31798/g.53644  ORF Transcript_31798/g.53644 Transcript_31798/m.53644 type:complete len:438 (+) Transcript_31798:76-1389(+)
MEQTPAEDKNIFEYGKFESDGTPVADPQFDAEIETKLTQYKDSIIGRPESMGEEDLSGEIIETKLNPDRAYGIFNGKIYPPSSVLTGPNHELMYEHSYYSLADSVERRAESPLQRYTRLRNELDVLKTDLDTMVADITTTTGASINNNNSTMWSVLQQETKLLIDNTKGLENHRALELVRANLTSQEQSLLNLASAAEGKQATTADSQMSTSGGGAEPEVSSMNYNDVIVLEKRLHRLEILLGSDLNNLDVHAAAQTNSTGSISAGGKVSTTMASNDAISLFGVNNTTRVFPLLDALTQLEQRVALLDPTSIETIKSKCNSLKSELETTLKSKSQITAEGKVVDAKAQLSELISTMQQVQTVAADLPALVTRLKTLEHVHVGAATVSTRLQQMEQQVADLSTSLSSNREVLAAMKESLAENIAVMQQNIQSVNHRLG